MVSPSSRRRVAKSVVEEGLANAAQACRLGLARSSYHLMGRKRLSTQKLERKIIALSEEHPRYGYRRITALLRRKGKPINAKRVQRVRRQAGLQVKERQERTRPLGPTMVKRLRAQRANQVWSWDLLYDQTEHGRSLRILSLIDEYTKECWALQVGYWLRGRSGITCVRSTTISEPVGTASERLAQ